MRSSFCWIIQRFTCDVNSLVFSGLESFPQIKTTTAEENRKNRSIGSNWEASIDAIKAFPKNSPDTWEPFFSLGMSKSTSLSGSNTSASTRNIYKNFRNAFWFRCKILKDVVKFSLPNSFFAVLKAFLPNAFPTSFLFLKRVRAEALLWKCYRVPALDEF